MGIESIEAAFAQDQATSNEEIARVHGDSISHSISRWRAEAERGETTLPYIDWRCDKRWCAANKRWSR